MLRKKIREKGQHSHRLQKKKTQKTFNFFGLNTAPL